MTRVHKVKYGGHFKRIYKYMNEENKDKIFYVKYNGETLYCILLKNYELMYVNNLKVETLHPKNKMAINYLNNKNYENRNYGNRNYNEVYNINKNYQLIKKPKILKLIFSFDRNIMLGPSHMYRIVCIKIIRVIKLKYYN